MGRECSHITDGNEADSCDREHFGLSVHSVPLAPRIAPAALAADRMGR